MNHGATSRRGGEALILLTLCACGAGGPASELGASPEPGPTMSVAPLAVTEPIATVLLPVATTLEIVAGNQVAFSGSCSTVAGRRLSHAWSLDGGAPATSASASPGAVTFATEGTYRVTYSCLDDQANTSNVVARTIVVRSPARVVLGLAIEPGGTAHVREPIFPAPALQLATADGLPAQQAGVAVTASLEGAGALGGRTTRTTDSQGRVVFSDLAFIGAAVGDRRLRFSSPGLDPVPSRSIRVTAGPGAQLAATSPTSQESPERAAVQAPPAVLVRDVDGNPVPGVPVRFDVVTGGGVVVGSQPFTDASGVARVTSWTLGTGTQQALRATLSGVPAAQVTFVATAISTATRYDVTLRYLNPLSETQRAAFESARRRIERMVVGDLPDLDLSVAASDNCSGAAISERVDDLLIAVRVVPIDGAGGTLGRAGPCLVRGGAGGLPVLALMEFDSDDLDALEARGQLHSVILHEMLHTLGFGTTWAALLVNGGLDDPFFDGAAAREAFMGDGWSGYGGVSVPVENAGNPGTRDAHWRESIFSDELMTGWLSGSTQPLSRTTIASLQDIGYRVDLGAADPMLAGATLRAMGVGPPPVHIGEDLLSIPVGTIDERGNVTPAQ